MFSELVDHVIGIDPDRDSVTVAALEALTGGTIARRHRHLNAEIAGHDAALKVLVDTAAPQLVAERGAGYVNAAAFYLAWSHKGRCRSEAAFARLAGTAPIEVTSGQNQERHRLWRGGDRQLNQALHLVAVTRHRSVVSAAANRDRLVL